MLTSEENNKAQEKLSNKLLEIAINRGMIAFYLLSPLSKIISLENTSQFKLVIDSTSKRVNGLLRHNSIPVTLYDNWLTFRE